MVETVCKLLWSERFFSYCFEGALWVAKAIAGLVMKSSRVFLKMTIYTDALNAKLPKLLLIKM